MLSFQGREVWSHVGLQRAIHALTGTRCRRYIGCADDALGRANACASVSMLLRAGGAYPDILARASVAAAVISAEEEAFFRTLTQVMSRCDMP